ncbi:MAG TPA: DUF3486 family protein [Methylophilaceae bacterium]|nr:DUF3486 family protein [Methylophilaceae bacterium]
MVKRSAIAQLPKEVQLWLDKTLKENNFSEYALLEEELKKRGFKIGKSSVHRYGQSLERKLSLISASTEAAQQIAASSPDDADLRSSAVISLVQSEVFEVLLMLQELDEKTDPAERLKLLGRAAKSIAELSRASVNQKKWQAQVREKTEAVAAEVDMLAKKGGLSAATLDTIKRSILGIGQQ